MHISQELQRAVQRFDWGTCKQYFENVDSEDSSKLLNQFVRVAIRDGYLILRLGGTHEAKRNAFVGSLKAYIESSAESELIQFFTEHYEYVRLTESVYHSILSTLEKDILTGLAPSHLAWFTVFKAERALREVIESAHSQLAKSKYLLDPVTAKTALDENGEPINPDAVITRRS